MVRNWRNDPKIYQFMEYREYITPEMQVKWFNRINNNNNYYFIIEVNNEDIGLINVKDIDYNQREGEVGIFIYNDKYLNSLVTFAAILCLSDFCFEKLNLKTLIAHTLQTNPSASRFIKGIGFELLDNQENIENQEYRLYEENYLRQKSKVSNVLNSVYTQKTT